MLKVMLPIALVLSACVIDLDEDADEGEVALQPFHGRFGSPTIVRDDDHAARVLRDPGVPGRYA